ncbi:hypothetical protein HN832_04300 [archaeon]|jgi:hypothetical protein|nr:hypothetical protein [archaeon]MBT4373384.1 hypothetical protein [archaeon]MBT4531832.1 hypothetical protein [archaeon]MBT7001499.1 hypothetical protein [archaeon]MBT7282609.1 hypothetical protein [archaeon]
MEYKPEYAEGQILVRFLEAQQMVFACSFGKGLGYELSEEGYPDYAFLFLTKPGNEDKAIEEFKAEADFVDGAYRRDLKREKRESDLEKLGREIQGLRNNIEIPKEEYCMKLRGIEKVAREIREEVSE